MSVAGPLSVRHIENNGYESVTQATSVMFQPGDGPTNNLPQLIAYGVLNPTSDGCNRYACGKVFVMNEAGQTVAKYDFDQI